MVAKVGFSVVIASAFLIDTFLVYSFKSILLLVLQNMMHVHGYVLNLLAKLKQCYDLCLNSFKHWFDIYYKHTV